MLSFASTCMLLSRGVEIQAKAKLHIYIHTHIHIDMVYGFEAIWGFIVQEKKICMFPF